MSEQLELPLAKKEKLKAEFTVDMATITNLYVRARAEARHLEGASIDNDADAADAAEHLRNWLRNLDQVSAMKKETLAPLKEAKKRINALFKPLLDAGQALTGGVRKLLEDYELGKRAAQRKAMAEATEAASEAQPEALLEALTAVEDAAPTQLEGTAFVRTWVIKRIIENLIPDVFWIVDRERIERIGKAEHGDKPFDIPGVVWEEKLSSRVRR